MYGMYDMLKQNLALSTISFSTLLRQVIVDRRLLAAMASLPLRGKVVHTYAMRRCAEEKLSDLYHPLLYVL